MRYLLILLASIIVFGSCEVEPNIQNADINIIPKPLEMKIGDGEFVLDVNTDIVSVSKATKAVSLFKEVFAFDSDLKSNKKGIKFELDNALDKEEYALEIKSDEIIIKSSSELGFIWAVRTLEQMKPLEFKGINKSNSLSFPVLNITDAPKFSWRGSMLDVCRHFMTVEKVKEYINTLSYHKMNMFHWHLTEDQGWRIEIKKYPKLTEIGAWRKDGNGGKYGGFYTQEQIKEVVAYADARGVTVVPEIEFPGHSVAALAAYPELSCKGGPFEVQTNWGVFDDILCAGNEDVFKFSEEVLTEVLSLFPSKYIHIGGDEAPKTRWKSCDKCQQRMKENGLETEHDLQSYFISRLEKFLISHNRKLIGWDEIMEGGLAPEATMQVWRDVEYGKQAVKQGHDIISSPTSHCYLDYSQKVIDVEKIYGFNPIPEGISEDEAKHVLGGEGNVWTERIPQSRLDYMAFPRITALSEALWTTNKNYSDFYKRLQKEYRRYDEKGIQYGPEGDIMEVKSSVSKEGGFIVSITPKTEGVSFKYYFKENPDKVFDYNGPIRFKKTTTLFVQAYRNNRKYGDSVEVSFIEHKARYAKIKNVYPADKTYKGEENTLIDGLYGSENFRDGKWKAYKKTGSESILTFNEETEVSRVIVSALSNVSSWIFLPKSISVYKSDDGKHFTKIGYVNNTEEYQGAKDRKKEFTIDFPTVKTRYIKVVVENFGKIPSWHGGRGSYAYLFLDEIIVE